MILKAYKYRIYPTNEQRTLLHKTFGCARFIYNWGLALRIKKFQEEKVSINSIDLCLLLTELKKEKTTEWLGEVCAQSLQAALRNLDNAYTRFFREKKGFPKFKKKSGHQSFQCPQHSKVDFANNTISIVKIKNIKAVFDRKFEGKVKTVTISKTPTNKYYASVLVETPDNPKLKVEPVFDKAIGVDLGLKHFAILSTGEKIENPKHLQKSMKQLRRLSKKLTKKKDKTSKRREKARLKLARLHEKVSNQRNDFLHKLSTRLIRENQSICLEALNIAGMLKNHCLAHSISSASWSRFIEMLKYKAEWYGVNILQIGRFEPSSKMCSCGHINNALKLDDRNWTCEKCNTTHDRDILAANNIKNFAFNEQSLIENLGNHGGENRAGLARINA